MAALMRQKRLPTLKKLLQESEPKRPQTPEMVRLNIATWAAGAGLRIKRSDGGAPTVSHG